MKQIENIYSVVKQVSQSLNLPELQVEIQNLARVRQSAIQNPQVIKPQIIQIIEKIIQIIEKIDTSLWTPDHFYIADKLGISEQIGDSGRRYFEKIKAQISSGPSVDPNLIALLTTQLNQLRTKPVQFLSLLENFELDSNINVLNPEEGIIEIVFDGDVAIDDFKEAKEQMNDWFLIIEGYARLLGVSREEFEIIGMSKNSPTKFKIKTTLTNVTLVLGIVTALLGIEKLYLDNKLTIEKLKKTELIADNDSQQKFIENAEKHIEEKIKKEIDKLVDKKLKEYKVPEGNGDIKNNLTKGIENQYNFMIHGGNVNIKVIDNKMKKEIDTLEKTKEELKRIKNQYEDQKSITETSENELE